MWNCVLNGRKEAKGVKKGGTEGEQRKTGRQVRKVVLQTCIKKQWFSLQCRKVNGLICLSTPQDWLIENTRDTLSSNLTEVGTKTILRKKKHGGCTFCPTEPINYLMKFIF